MKHIWQSFFFVLFSLSCFSQNWVEIGQVPESTSTPFDIHFFNKDFGIGLSATGTFRTSDGGFNWTKIDSRGGGDVAFRDIKNGLIITNKSSSASHLSDFNISSDSGKSWTVPYKIIEQDMYATRGQFISADTGYIILRAMNSLNRKSKIYKTTNGAEDWTEVLSDTSITELTELEFIDAQNGFVSGLMQDTISIIMRTSNGGQSWTKHRIDSISIKIRDMEMIDSLTGFIISLFDRRMYKTTDGWSTYYPVFTDTGVEKLHVKFPSATIGYAHVISKPSGNGEMYSSIDQGESWVFQDTLPFGFNVMELFFLDDTTGWLLGQRRKVLALGVNKADTTSTSIKSAEIEELIQVYPNPVHSHVVVENRGIVPIRFLLFNQFGQKIKDELVNGNKSTIQLKECADGIYHYQINKESSKLKFGQIILHLE